MTPTEEAILVSQLSESNKVLYELIKTKSEEIEKIFDKMTQEARGMCDDIRETRLEVSDIYSNLNNELNLLRTQIQHPQEFGFNIDLSLPFDTISGTNPSYNLFTDRDYGL